MKRKFSQFGYDARSELTSATLGNAAYAYAFDNVGNRSSATEAGTQLAYTTNAQNQYPTLTKTPAQGQTQYFTPTYDADGNAELVWTETGIWVVSYDAKNRPVSFRDVSTGTLVECAYDYRGRRCTKKVTVAGTVTLHHRYIYRGYLQIACVDLTRSGHPALWFVLWDPTQPTATRPLALQKDGTWYTYGCDITKNVCEVFGPAGYIRTSYSYTPFGAVSASGDVSQPFQWSSEHYDSETALVYYNYRHYSPDLGRWLSRDPIEEQGGRNLYAFVKNNPLPKWDRLGRSMIAPGAEVWHPMRPPEQVYYPSYPESICNGYNPEAAPKCCREGKLVNDPYPQAAFNVCQQFVRIYNGSFLAENMACVANCLIGVENSIADEPDCANKNNARMNAHVSCYWNCKFVPILKLPEGGTKVGIEMLYPDWEYSGTLLGCIVLGALKICPEEDFINRERN